MALRYTRLLTGELYDNHHGMFVHPNVAAHISADEISDEHETSRRGDTGRVVALAVIAVVLALVVFVLVVLVGNGVERSGAMVRDGQEALSSFRSIAEARRAGL